MTYTFIIKDDKTKNYRLISQLLVIFNLLGLAFLLIKNGFIISKHFMVLFAVLIAAIYTFFTVVEFINKKPLPDFWHRTVFAVCALAWAKERYWWLTIILLLFIMLDMIAHRELVIEITEKEIVMPYFPREKREWNEMSNVILKDGLLTIDFKNNKLFQQLVLNSDQDINEKEFNEFCRRQLNK